MDNSATGSSVSSACFKTLESICRIRLGSHSSSNQHSSMSERMVDPRRRLGTVGDRNHHWGGLVPVFLPTLRRFPPVVAQQVVGVSDQVRQRLVGLCSTVQVVSHFVVVIDVIEAGLVCLASGTASSLTTTRGVLTRPDSMASFNPKSLTIQLKRDSSAAACRKGRMGLPKSHNRPICPAPVESDPGRRPTW